MALLICFCGVAIPLELAFEPDMIIAMCGSLGAGSCPMHQSWVYCNLVIDVCFMFDILVNCRTGYLKEGHFVSDDYRALRHYLKGWFIIDLVGSFPINFVLDYASGCDARAASNPATAQTLCGVGRSNKMLRMLRMFKLMKIIRMLKLTRYLEYVEVVVKFNPALLRVLRLCLWSLISCHWFGCLWWLVSDWEMADSTVIGPDGLPTYVAGFQEWAAGENQWLPPLWLCLLYTSPSPRDS